MPLLCPPTSVPKKVTFTQAVANLVLLLVFTVVRNSRRPGCLAVGVRLSSPAHPFGTWGHRQGTQLGLRGDSEKPLLDNWMFVLLDLCALPKQLDVCTIEAIELSSLFVGSAILRGSGLEIPMGSSAHCGYWNLATLPQLELKLASNIFKCVCV